MELPSREHHSAERDALACARNGDRDSLGELLDGFRNYLFTVANHELDDQLRAKCAPSDLVQDTFIKAQQTFTVFQGATEEELRAWLRQILVHRCRDLRDMHLQAAKGSVTSLL